MKAQNRSVVVGSGPSLIGNGLGEYIDSFEFVLRFPYAGNWQSPEDFGKKTTHYCSTTARARHRLRQDLPSHGYFIWAKKTGRNIGSEFKFLIERFGGKDVSVLIKTWQNKLPEYAYPYLSHGTAGILIAAAELKKDVIAIGCDMLKDGNPDKPAYKGSYIYENRKENKSHHSLDCERELIDEMAKHYGVNIYFR